MKRLKLTCKLQNGREEKEMNKQQKVIRTKEEKALLDAYFRGQFNAGLLGIEKALQKYSENRAQQYSFQHAKQLVATIADHLDNMENTCIVSQEVDEESK